MQGAWLGESLTLPEDTVQERGSPLIFFTLTLCISWLIWLPGVLDNFNILSLNLDPSIYTMLNVIGGAIPTILGLFLYYREEGKPKLREVLARGVDPRKIGKIWWLPLLFLIPLINGAALALGILTGGPVPNIPLLQTWYLIPIYFIVGFIPISNAFREEFGWRGYAIERLQVKHGALTTSVIIGFVWGLWHLPLRYFPGGVEVYSGIPIWVFMINTITISIMMTWLYNNNKGSIFTGVVFHVMLNLTPSIFPFGQTALGVYINMILYVVVAVLIVLYYGVRNLKRDSSRINLESNQ